MHLKRNFIVVLCLSVIVAMFVGPGPAVASSPIEVKEYQVISNPADQYGPRVKGYFVAYNDNRNGNADIFLVNKETGVEIQLTSGIDDEILGGFDGTSIVYTTNTNPSGSFVYNIQSLTATPLAVTYGSSNQSSPAVGGNIASWIDDRDGNNELYLRDLITLEERRVTNTPANDESNPDVSAQGRVAFESCSGGSCDILWFDPLTGNVSPVTNSPEDERNPDIDGDSIVYDANRDGDSDVYLFNVVSGIETRISLPGVQHNANISGDFVSFEDSSSGMTHIVLYRISTGLTYHVTPNTSNQFLNDISPTTVVEVREGRIVYTDDRHGNLDVFMTKFELPDEGDECNGIDDNHDGRTDEGYPSGNTHCGTDVEVIEENPDDATDITSITFPSVDISGDTVVTTLSTGPTVPSGFECGKKSAYHEITSTVGFNGLAQVCIGYDPAQFTTERSLRLLHWYNGRWDNITSNVNTAANIICGMTSSFSPFVVAQQSSTAVTLTAISAHKDGDKVTISWSTSSETDNEGFNIYRGESANGPFTLITPGVIPAVGGLGMKATYTFTDTGIQDGKTYYYRLQDIDSKGMITSHEVVPVTVDVANQKKDDGGASRSEVRTGEEKSLQSESGQSGPAAQWTKIAVIAPAEVSVVREADSAALTGENKVPAERTYDEAPDESAKEPALHAGFREQQFREAGRDAWTQTGGKPQESSASSSFAVSIEDERGNLIKVSKAGSMTGAADQSGNLEITEEAGRVAVMWKGAAHSRGFVLHRSEKGKNNYAPVSDLIPYFGHDSKDVFLYRFIDNSVRPGAAYDYRLETVGTDSMDSHKKLSS